MTKCIAKMNYFQQVKISTDCHARHEIQPWIRSPSPVLVTFYAWCNGHLVSARWFGIWKFVKLEIKGKQPQPFNKLGFGSFLALEQNWDLCFGLVNKFQKRHPPPSPSQAKLVFGVSLTWEQNSEKAAPTPPPRKLGFLGFKLRNKSQKRHHEGILNPITGVSGCWIYFMWQHIYSAFSRVIPQPVVKDKVRFLIQGKCLWKYQRCVRLRWIYLIRPTTALNLPVKSMCQNTFMTSTLKWKYIF